MQHKTPETKLCPECQLVKSSSLFNLNSARSDGLTYVCAECIPKYEARSKKKKKVLSDINKGCVSCLRTLPSRMYLYDQNSEDKLRSKCRTCCAFKRKNPSANQIIEYETFVREITGKACSLFDPESQRSQLEQFVYQQMVINGLIQLWHPPVWVHKTSLPE